MSLRGLLWRRGKWRQQVQRRRRPVAPLKFSAGRPEAVETGRVKELDDRREFCATTVYDVLSAAREADFENAVQHR